MKNIDLALMSILCLGLCCSGCTPKAAVTVRIVDDNKQPVPDATIAVHGFDAKREGKTDKDGFFIVKMYSTTGQLDLNIKKDGFYTIWWYSYFFKTHTNNQWVPWNPTIELQLYKIGKPVPMVVKRVEEEIPILGQPVGYDLLKSDWVKPYGHGETPDFIFEAKRWSNGTNNVNGWLRLTFSNPQDGLLPVSFFWRDNYELRLPAIAPKDGYRSQVWWAVGESEQPPGEGWLSETNMNQDANYYLRVRSHAGTNGEPREALYGKIYKGISLGLWNYRTNVTVNFEYYLNPGGTRNTEFDTRSNLCPNPGDAGGKP